MRKSQKKTASLVYINSYTKSKQFHVSHEILISSNSKGFCVIIATFYRVVIALLRQINFFIEISLRNVTSPLENVSLEKRKKKQIIRMYELLIIQHQVNK